MLAPTPHQTSVAGKQPSAPRNAEATSSVSSASALRPSNRLRCCLICMSRFTTKNPAIAIPCEQKCNDSPVHLKCIHQWQRQQEHGPGSCPLCRGALGPIGYSPTGQVSVAALTVFSARRHFCTRPVGQSAPVLRCYVVLDKDPSDKSPLYRMYVQAPSRASYPRGAMPSTQSPAYGDRLLLVGRTRWDRRGRCVIDMSLDRDAANFSRQSTQFMGRVESSLLGLSHTVKVPLSCTSQVFVAKEALRARRASLGGVLRRSFNRLGADPLVEVAAVGFMQNRMGRAVGPRKMKVCLAALVEEASVEAQVLEWQKRIRPQRRRSLAAQVYAVKGALRRSLGESTTSSSRGGGSGGGAPRAAVGADGACVHNMSCSKSGVRRHITGVGAHGGARQQQEGQPEEENDLVIEHSCDCVQDGYETEGEQEENEETVDNMLEDDKLWSIGSLKATRRTGSLLSELRKGQDWINQQPGLLYASNLEPYWLASIQAYSLDFNGRVLLPSNKNFQLVVDPAASQSVALQFGKVCEGQKEVYTMDLRWPMTPLQSFGIVLASCARKLACA